MAQINLYDSTVPANAPVRSKRQYLPAATTSANSVGVILVQEFGQQPWILQAMAAVQEAVQNCIQNLSGTVAPVMNADALVPGAGGYAMPARTREELQASSAQAAHAGQVSQARAAQVQAAQQAEVALANGQLDMFAVLQDKAGLQDPASQGIPPTAPAPEVQSESGSDEWLL